MASREAGYAFVGSCRDRRLFKQGRAALDALERYALGHRNLHKWDPEKDFPNRDEVDKAMGALDRMARQAGSPSTTCASAPLSQTANDDRLIYKRQKTPTL